MEIRGRNEIAIPSVLVLLLLLVGFIYRETAHNLLIERGSGAQALVFPAFLWIVWESRARFANLPVQGSWFGLGGLLAAGFVWLVGEFTFVRVLTDIALVAMYGFAAIAILGARWMPVLGFPLCFLLFMIPIGGPIVPVLVDWTARFSFMALRASQIPIYREGAYFIVPTGSWTIADACSGVAYLGTCLMLGVLYAWTMYQSLRKRAIFMAGIVILGIVGNWLRAYLTIYIAHVSNNRFLRDGHGTFGWVLFAGLLFAYCWFAWRLSDPVAAGNARPQSGPDSAGGIGGAPHARSVSNLAPAVLALVALLAWPAVRTTATGTDQIGQTQIAAIEAAAGWQASAKSSTRWTPELQNPTQVSIQNFEKDGQQVSVLIAIFKNQTWQSKLVTYVNQFADSENPNWSQIDRGNAVIRYAGDMLKVRTGVILGQGIRIVAWQWYWVDGMSTSSDSLAKLEQLTGRLKGKPDVSAWVCIYSRADAAASTASATLEQFLGDMGASIRQSLVRSTTGD